MILQKPDRFWGGHKEMIQVLRHRRCGGGKTGVRRVVEEQLQ